jgi:plastocyanin
VRRAALLVLPLLAFLAAPSVAAAPAPVQVVDFAYQPKTLAVAAGDTVTWKFNDETHTVTSDRDQTTTFNSGDKSPGATYVHTFAKRGSFTYHCQIHPFMHGRVNVGPAPFPDSTLPKVTALKAKGGSGRVTLRFKLSERSTVRVKLTGASRHSAKRKLGKGKRKLVVKGLATGRYKATVTAKDKAGHKSRKAAVKRFRVR